MHGWCAVAALLALLLGVLLGHEVAPPAPVALVEDGTPGMLPVSGGVVPTANMPSKPLPGQKKAPCASDETEHLGACWMKVGRQPPCREYYRLGSACYVPVGEPPKGQPLTIEP